MGIPTGMYVRATYTENQKANEALFVGMLLVIKKDTNIKKRGVGKTNLGSETEGRGLGIFLSMPAQTVMFLLTGVLEPTPFSRTN